MDIRRVILYAALALVVYSLWTSWQVDYPVVPQQQATTVQSTSGDPLLPASLPAQAATNKPIIEPVSEVMPAESSKTIHVKTDVLDLTIDLQHGDIIDANLLDYPVSVTEKNKPFPLLQNNAGQRYVANSNLFLVRGQTIENADGDYTTEYQEYQLPAGQKKLVVTLKGKNRDGLLIQKDFVFSQGSYLIDVRYQLTNEGTTAWKGYLNTQLLRSSPQEDKTSMFHVGSYTGASYSNPGKSRYKKVNFNDMTKANLDVDVESGWIAMQQHYFLTAWVPTADRKSVV